MQWGEVKGMKKMQKLLIELDRSDPSDSLLDSWGPNEREINKDNEWTAAVNLSRQCYSGLWGRNRALYSAHLPLV